MEKKIKDYTDPPDALMQDIIEHYRVSESVCSVAKFAQKDLSAFRPIYGAIVNTFGEMTWKQLFNKWKQANVVFAGKNPVAANGSLNWSDIADAIRHVPVDPSTILPMPKTQAEQELADLKRKHDNMTPEERAGHFIGIALDAPAESLEIILSGMPKEAFGAMYNELSEDEKEGLKTDVWSGWVAYLRTDVHVPQDTIDFLTTDPDRMQKSLDIAKSTLRAKGEYKRMEEPEVKQRIISRRCILHTYQKSERKYFKPNINTESE